MRRTLLIAACSLFLAGTQAFAADQQKWSKSVENTVSKWEELNLQAPTAVDNAGNTYATGAFTQPIVIGSTVLDPIANSAYLAKYDAEGNVAWAVGLRGAATITAITTDEQNNVYVAGTLADAVEVGSTDGKTQTINGKAGEVENQVSSFIAAYSAEGALKATKVIWTETDATVAEAIPNGSYEGSPNIQINHLAVAGNKLYASALYTGDLTMDDMKWEGSYLDLFGYYMDYVSGGIFSVDKTTLSQTTSIANIVTTGLFTMGTSAVKSISLTTGGNDIYMCFSASGNVTYNKADQTSEDFVFPESEEASGYVVSSIKEGRINSKTFTTTITKSTAFGSVNDMKIEGENLYIAGCFQEALAFDNTLTAKDACDLYTVALNKNNFELQWAAQSNLNEGNGDAQHFYENFTAMTVNNGEVSLYGYVIQNQDNKKTITKSLAYTCSNSTTTSNDVPLLVTGAATNGTTKALLSANITDFSTTLAAYTVSGGDGINGVKALSAQRVGNTFYFAEPNDITVYDLQGRMLKQANHATSVSIDDLNQGIYILSNGKSTMKAQKTNF
ncbi:T9SS type A sorting domain-containing protein [Paraprevotella clara]|uniref:T9SS type A sorting domain-containing protein n=2 Tax=Paraprevotella clara TaxID=454154 RepID=UPI0018A8DF8B|nr:T9SS type A sorting domain-containing protein [Paraprevotella clara]